MGSASNTRKLIMVALYTSPVIGTLAITPNFIMANEDRPGYYFHALLVTTPVVLLIWSINILLAYFFRGAGYTRSRRILHYLLSYGLCTGAFSFIASQWMFHGAIPANEASYAKFYHFHVIIFLSINTVILVLQDLVQAKERNIAIGQENAQLKVKNMEAINQQLRQQVHPHFLFNSLSTLKALIKPSPEQAEDYVVRLSEFLRASLSPAESNLVQVAEELEICGGYLDMQQIRFGQALQWEITIPEAIREQGYVPLFSIQMLIENAIKHNMLTLAAPLHISIGYREGWVSVENNLQRIPRNPHSYHSPGIGLANLRERYSMFSGDGVSVEEDGQHFFVRIKVLANEDSHH
jgi:sensor histidine kinase YesM